MYHLDRGYERLEDPVRHRRTWIYERRLRKLRVTDDVQCRRAHRLEWLWHFAPGCGVSVGANTLVARRESVTLTLSWPSALAGRLVTASEHPPLGWYSSTLDRKQPAITAVIEAPVVAGASSQVSIDFDLTIDLSGPTADQ